MIPWLQAGNVAVITGGANGIGRAAARHYVEHGMNVLLADVDSDALDATRASMPATGGQVETFICDVSDYQSVVALKDKVLDLFGRVDCLMNNAGAGVTRAVPWEDIEGWKKQLNINLWGVIHGCQAFIPAMLETASASAVINTGSKQGITNPPGGYAYNLSKAGVVNYTQSLAHALRETENCQISAHLLVPGFTYSNMIAKFMPEKPAGAWSCEQVVEYLMESLAAGDFYIICPDNDTPRDVDNKRMQWGADDMIKNRPALSRWHPDYVQAYEEFMQQS